MKTQAFKKTYEGRVVLDFPEFEFEEGKIYAVIGPNGCGKSTLAKAVSGMIKNDDEIRIVPAEVSVGYMPQYSFAFRRSTIANLLMVDRNEERAKKLLKAFRMEHLEKVNAKRLSGGETQKMALGRMLMKKFDFLILDEPSASMDIEATVLAERQIVEYNKETGNIILLITHSMRQAERIADELLFLHQGKLKENGPCREHLSDPKTEELINYLAFQ